MIYPAAVEVAFTFVGAAAACLLFYFLLLSIRRVWKQQKHKWPSSYDQQHCWESLHASEPGYFCNVCETNLFYGAECENCGIVVDVACIPEANIAHRCKSISQEEQPMLHQWIRGNVPANSVCFLCNEECHYGPGLVDRKCCWCQRVVHDACLPNATDSCDLGQFKNFIVPPNCVQVRRSRWRPNKHYTVDYINKPNDGDQWRPVFVFGNKESGSGESTQVMRSLKRFLNPIQIFDLCQSKPSEALKILNHFNSDVECYILVAGGDGTFGWILETIEDMQIGKEQFPKCTMALLPLGTGNDLSRVLGWLSGECASLDGRTILSHLTKAKCVTLDRWMVKTVGYSKLGVPWPMVKKKMSNYLSVGVDALVTYNFHRKRNSVPRVLSGRFMNKLLFFTYGTKDLIDRMCRNLHLKIELFLDGKKVSLPHLESVVVLNIPSWGAGVQAWQLGCNAPEQSMCDGILEIFGVYSAFHIAQMQVGLSEPYRIGQAKEVRIKIKEGPLPVQIDGEPWQQGPCTISIEHYAKSVVLGVGDDGLNEIIDPTEGVKFKLF